MPQRPNLEHLKKQAKDLLRKYQNRDPDALRRFRNSLPAAKENDDNALVAADRRLHDAQSCIAREYGFSSWDELSTYVQWGRTDDPSHLTHRWLVLVYGHQGEKARPAVAARMLEEKPNLLEHHPSLACAAGDETILRRIIAIDKEWVNRPATLQCPECGAPLGRPPLMAVTHSSLVHLVEFRDRLRACARILLDAGADPNQPWTEGEHQLTALCGAAGTNHDVELTQMLLAAGANPNDGQSLYHAVGARQRTCVKLLLDAGAKVEGSNALHHQLDTDDLEGLRLLLAHTKDPNDQSSSLGNPLLWAIRRRRSRAHIEMLLHSGADPDARNQEGTSAYVLALHYGLSDVADALQQGRAIEPLSVEDQFVSACARAERADAERILSAQPDIFQRLSESQMRQLPNLTEAGCSDAVRLMVEVGWPIAIRGGDWDASALNLAVFRGDAELTRFLLGHGASWTEQHGHGDNVNGTLAWASRNHDPDQGDWVGCAQALIEHGLPAPEVESDYSDEVAEVFAIQRTKLKSS